jgi:glucuronosyltransferase
MIHVRNIFHFCKKVFWDYSYCCENLCKDAVLNKKFMAKLQQTKFDVLIADGIGPCGEPLPELFKIPFVYMSPLHKGHKEEKYSRGPLFPPFYVLIVMSGLSGPMTFMERVKNIVCMLLIFGSRHLMRISKISFTVKL